MSGRAKRKKPFGGAGLVLLLALILPLSVSSLCIGQAKEVNLLQSQIEKIINRVDGVVGVAIKHLESGEEVQVNEDTLFPMASTFKVAVMVEVFHQIKEGKFGLDDEAEMAETDLHLGSGMLSSLQAPGIKLSIRNFITLMMIISDNSAADFLLEKVGVDNVNHRMEALGLTDIHIDRSCHQLIMEYLGIDYQKYKDYTLKDLEEELSSYDYESPAADEARAKFNREAKDICSPAAMNSLLEKIFKAEMLDRETCDLMLEIMLGCQTGENRLRGILPRGTRLAHKTGTIATTVNDCGIIYLPDDRGHIAITVFSKEVQDETEDMERVIAEVARFAFDYYYFYRD
ncbi:MAG: serine hydrolase [Acidobacteriota bacterium]